MKRLLLTAAALSLAACATPYQDMGWFGGVEAAQVTSDTYRINARGNSRTSTGLIRDYMLLRAAETALEAGETHFDVLDDSAGTRTTGALMPNNNSSGPGIALAATRTEGDMLVRIHSDPGPNSFDAAEIVEVIGGRVSAE